MPKGDHGFREQATDRMIPADLPGEPQPPVSDVDLRRPVIWAASPTPDGDYRPIAALSSLATHIVFRTVPAVVTRRCSRLACATAGRIVNVVVAASTTNNGLT